MKTITLPTCLLLALLLDLGARAQGTAFTYQGRLQDTGEPANGTYDLRFTLFDVPIGGAPLGVPNDLPTVAVTGGLFQVVLDFGPAAFDGLDRWLEVAVRASGQVVPHTDLAPRQPITAVPYAMRATTALQVSGTIPDGKLSSNVALRNSNNMFLGNQIVPNHNVAVGTDSLNARLTIGDPDPSVGPTGEQPGKGMALSLLNRFGFRVSEGGSGDAVRYFNLDYYADDQWRGPALTISRLNGNVGIGTTVPQSRLDVAGTVTATTFRGDGSGLTGIAPTDNSITASRLASDPASLAKVSGGVLRIFENKTKLTGLLEIGACTNVLAVDESVLDLVRGCGALTNAMLRAFRDGKSDSQLILILQRDGKLGLGTPTPQATLHVNGNARVDGTHTVKVLSITGGADVAEPFSMSSQEVPKGAVVVIDDAHPGQLRLSDRAYDKRVAGVVSGAGGVNPGLTLSQHELVEGGQNVALTGRVYVLADPVNGPIEPGDLLTTAATPGHAMKVTDHTQAQGAILGKAMSRLESGRGLVLMLVTLQ